MSVIRIVANFRGIFLFFSVLAIGGGVCSCTVEHAEETILATHANGAKKTSIWIYPDGEILKRNEWYSDGIKELEIPYKDSVPHGDFKRWTGYGDLVMEGEYKKGLRHGKWISYYGGHFNKKTEAIRYYKEDHPVGDWEGWHFNGERAFEEHYSDNGDSIGVWKKWNDDGSIAEENSCFGTSMSGLYRKFNFNGIPESEHHCKYGKKHGESRLYYSDGKKLQTKKTWIEDSLWGERIHFYANAQIQKREFWKANERDSIWQWYTPEGELIAESNILKDRRSDYGICTKTLNDSNLNYFICAESTFVNYEGHYVLDDSLWFFKEGHELRYEEFRHMGQLVKSLSYYPDTVKTANGDTIVFKRLASEGFWAALPPNGLEPVQRDLRHGIWRNWYRSGILRDSLTYVNGERVGEQFSYDSTGKLTIHKTENGKNRPVIMHILDER